jgi:alkyl hydroperoxide reductase subunit D
MVFVKPAPCRAFKNEETQTMSQTATAPAAEANIESLKALLPDFAKVIRLNLSSVIKQDPNSGLTLNQVHGIALASAYATKDDGVIAAVRGETAALSEAEVNAAKSAASIMAMNNVYYRFVHLVGGDYKTLPAKLRMNVIGAPGLAKLDFELMSMAVSAINGCGMCMEAHAHELTKAGASTLAVQSSVRIAAVISAAAQSLRIAAL